MPQYQPSKEYLKYSSEYQEYLAVRDMCRMMIALHEEDFDSAVDVWKKHEGPHYRLVLVAISTFIPYLVGKDQDPAEWARGYDAYAGAQDVSVRDMCRMTIALHQEDYDMALDIWNEHEGQHVRLATEAIGWVTTYLLRDGRDPVEWARGYEAYEAKQAGCQPSLTEEKAKMVEVNEIRNDQPEGFIPLAIAATTKRLGIVTAEDHWEFFAGDDTSSGHPYVQHHITPGRLWLRVTGGLYDDDGQPSVWCRIWCPQVLGGDASVPMERFALDGLQMVIGPAATKPTQLRRSGWLRRGRG
jgi:hypothetical protein